MVPDAEVSNTHSKARRVVRAAGRNASVFRQAPPHGELVNALERSNRIDCHPNSVDMAAHRGYTYALDKPHLMDARVRDCRVSAVREIESRSAGELRVTLLSDLEQILPLSNAWNALCKNAADATFFQSFDWNLHVARVRQSEPGLRFKPLVAALRRGGSLVGVWPLAMSTSLGASVVRALDDPFGQFGGAVFERGADVVALVRAVLRELSPVADALQVSAVPVDSRLHAALLQYGAQVIADHETVVVDLRSFSSFDEYLNSIRSRTRKNVRNFTNRIERSHRVQSTIVEELSDVEGLQRSVFKARLNWLHKNGRSSRAFRTHEFADVVMSSPRAQGIRVLGFALKTENACISQHWGFVHDGAYYAYMSAIDPAHREFSPGRLHMRAIIESCFQRGIKVIELMPPAADYKLEWGNRTQRLETMRIPLSVRGRLALGAVDWTDSTARQCVRLLPAHMRTLISRKVNKSRRVGF